MPGRFMLFFFIFYVIEKHFVFHYNGEDKLKLIFRGYIMADKEVRVRYAPSPTGMQQ